MFIKEVKCDVLDCIFNFPVIMANKNICAAHDVEIINRICITHKEKNASESSIFNHRPIQPEQAR
jgi:hypothetical protein